MSQEANDILTRASQLNRHLYRAKIADATEAQSEQSSPTAYKAFDTELGLARLQDGNGNILYGDAQTNGAVRLGENIRLRRGGVISGYDGMPTLKTDKPIPSSKTETKQAAILYYLPEQRNELTAPNIADEWYFRGGRCRPNLTSFQGFGDIYQGIEECKLLNSIVKINPYPYTNTISLATWYTIDSLTYDYTGVNFTTTFIHNKNYSNYYLLEFLIGTQSSFISTIEISSTTNISTYESIQSGVYLNRNTIFSPTQNGLLGYPPNTTLRGYTQVLNDSAFTTTLMLPANDSTNDSVNLIQIPILFNMLGGGTGTTNITVSGRIQAIWNPLPEPIATKKFYIKNDKKTIELFETCEYS